MIVLESKSKRLPNLPQWKATLIRRSANMVADSLAKLGAMVELVFNSSLPIHIWNIYSLEMSMQEVQRGSNTPQSQEHHILEQ